MKVASLPRPTAQRPKPSQHGDAVAPCRRGLRVPRAARVHLRGGALGGAERRGSKLDLTLSWTGFLSNYLTCI